MKKDQKVVIAGGAGFVGRRLTEKISELGFEVTVLDIAQPRNIPEGLKFIKLDLVQEKPSLEILENSFAIINLTGFNIDCRWNQKNKKLILDSRITSNQNIRDAVRSLENKPSIFLSASATGFYGDTGGKTVDESAPTGNDFLSYVCSEWEKSARQVEASRSVQIRTAPVIGPGGLVAKLLPLFKLGLGAGLGSGRQNFAWISIDDLTDIYIEAITNPKLSGPINACHPKIISNAEFTRSLAKTLNRPTWFKVPKSMLYLIYGREKTKTMLTIDQRIKPQKLIDLDFKFKDRSIDQALKKAVAELKTKSKD